MICENGRHRGPVGHRPVTRGAEPDASGRRPPLATPRTRQERHRWTAPNLPKPSTNNFPVPQRRSPFRLAPPADFPFLGRMASLRHHYAPILGLALAAAAVNATDVSSPYRAAITVEAVTGGVLFEDRADLVGAPASMTKLMTFAVLHDRLEAGTIDLNTPIRVTAADARMGGTQVYLDPRETFSVEELIYAMMVQSANDAAHALARASAGSVSLFVDRMNAKARELGMFKTTFRTPHGLPPTSRRIADGDLTTPRDFVRLCRHLLAHTNVTKYTSVRLRPFGAGIRARPMAMTNHNRLLRKVDGIDGLKTGYTRGAGFCLAATAQRNGRRVIVVTMGSPDAQTRDLQVIELLDRGFAALPTASTEAVSSSNRPAPDAPPPAEPVIHFSIPGR